MTSPPMQLLAEAMRQHGLVRFIDYCERKFPDTHLKDLTVEESGPHRQVVVAGRRVVNFGCDGFLGLDEHPKVREAVRAGLEAWGTHNGSSRAFTSVEANARAEEKLARWLGTEAVLIYPSVTAVNLGALPGLLGRRDLLAVDGRAHESVLQGAKLAGAAGVRVEAFAHDDPADLERVLGSPPGHRVAVVAVNGVSSMTGGVAPLAAYADVARRHRAVLYVDDAHGTGVLGGRGRGTVLDALGSYDGALAVGSLSKAFSCAGGFVGCPADVRRMLQVRSPTYLFSGPVPPPYLEAVCAVCDILMSPEYDALIGRLRGNVRRLLAGLASAGVPAGGGRGPIVSVPVGPEDETLRAGHFLFGCGFYVQSVVFPAVPYQRGLLRVQVNANHLPESIDGLLDALSRWHRSRRPARRPAHAA